MSRDVDIETLITWLLDKIRDDRKVIVALLSSGRVTSLEEYRFNVGQIRGLELAAEHIRNLSRAAEEE